jgi:O-antigen ligase
VLIFGINGIWGVHPKNWFKQKWWLLCVLWLASYAITYFWSTDKHSWHERIDTKLPFLILPLAFANLPRFSANQLVIFTVSVAILMLYGAGHSTWFFIQSPAYYIHQYGFAKILPTPVESDHICFSMSVALYIIWCVFFFPFIKNKFYRWFVACTVVLLSVYLHLLSAKSGLLSWYFFMLCWIIYIAVKRTIWTGLAVAMLLVTFAVAAYFYIPTLSTRVGYTEYSIGRLGTNDSIGNYSDLGRIISDDISIKLIRQHPFTGVGAGDILEEMKIGYSKWYPDVRPENRLFPHNQFLTVAVGCGIIAALIFIILIFYPLSAIKRNRQGFFTIIIWTVLLIPLMAEPFLEIQFGVFVYLFFLLWMWKIRLTDSSMPEKD